MKDLYRGSLVRLSASSPEELARHFARWNQDTEFHRLADDRPARLLSEKKIKENVEREQFSKDPRAYRFSICTLAEENFIGVVGLVPEWAHGDGWLFIFIGDRDYWSKGYGTDAMRLIVQFGFLELNLRRITLALNSYNTRALKTYQKVGFVVEGVQRSDGQREGVRYDGIYMGLLREEWLAQQEAK